MGIPSYYKKLKKFARRTLDTECESLWFDFNCVIYDCLHRGVLDSYEDSKREVWEAYFIEEIIKYTKELIGNIVVEKIFIMIDGVVPMAKIRQQRLRRFKSVKNGWDTNAITPGTQFMEQLYRRLTQEGWYCSGTDEPGEGEQKIMSMLRSRQSAELRHTVPSNSSTLESCSVSVPNTGSRAPAEGAGAIVIYGLDADLILLSLLQSTKSSQAIYLMREEKEDGLCYYMSINDLREVISNNDDAFLLDYIFCMTLMGNDFLPHSMSLTLRENGHDLFLSILRQHVKENGNIIVDGEYCKDRVVGLIRKISLHEEILLVKKIRSKFMMPAGEENVVSREEQVLLMKGAWKLRPDWVRTYYKWFHSDKDAILKEYYTGLQWVLNYYTGRKEISFDWYYPWNIAPLWRDLAEGWVESEGFCKEAGETYLKPQEQLAIVLPKSSWWLIRDKKLATLINIEPVFWPDMYDVFSVGRVWLWECVPKIPILSSKRLRHILKIV